LQSATQALQAAIGIDPSFCEGWSTWGCVLAQIGLSQGEASYFQEALQKFATGARALDQLDQEKQGVFYWQWGWCWFLQGRHSGEAQDFRIALGHYQRSSDLGIGTADFWVDYGNALVELSQLINGADLLLKATELFRSALRQVPDHFEAWYHLGCCGYRLLIYTKENSYFQLAHECLKKAVELRKNSALVWFSWGKLLLEEGSRQENSALLEESCQKFSQAYALESDHAHILSAWAEAEMHWGAIEERLELLRSAEEKITRSLHIYSKDTDAWGIYGACLMELAHYFEDDRLFEQAIEKIRYGLTLDSHKAGLWHALALAYFALGESHQDASMIEQSVSCSSRAVSCSKEMVPQFWNDWGVALMALFEISEERTAIEAAIQKFERILGSDWSKEQKEIECLYNYGCALNLLGSLTENALEQEKAIQVLAYVLQLNPDHIQARQNFALAYLQLGQLTDEISHYQNAMEQFEHLAFLDPEDAVVLTDWGTTLIHIGFLTQDISHSQSGKEWYERAEEKLLQAISLGALNAYYPLGCVYSLLENPTAAMHYIEKAELVGTLPTIDHLGHDEWLENLRDTAGFRNFIQEKREDRSEK
jgi:tetratricopeptide (TPR) repeat protein